MGATEKSETGAANTLCKERKEEGMPCQSHILKPKSRVNIIQISELTHPHCHWTETIKGF